MTAANPLHPEAAPPASTLAEHFPRRRSHARAAFSLLAGGAFAAATTAGALTCLHGVEACPAAAGLLVVALAASHLARRHFDVLHEDGVRISRFGLSADLGAPFSISWEAIEEAGVVPCGRAAPGASSHMVYLLPLAEASEARPASPMPRRLAACASAVGVKEGALLIPLARLEHPYELTVRIADQLGPRWRGLRLRQDEIGAVSNDNIA